jgi:D-alanyl-D-alanine dipeptidase
MDKVALARVMCESLDAQQEYVNYDGGFDCVTIDGHFDILPVVEAAAAEMHRQLMEPSSAMIDRFVSRALCVTVHGDGGWSNYAREQWTAMLSAFMAEGGK